MGHYQHLTIDERETAMVMRGQGMSMRAIADMLNRAASTVSRELRRNGRIDGTYSAQRATRLYRKRRKVCCQVPIMVNPLVAQYVIDRMQDKWTPEQIAGRAALEGFPIPFSYVTIYRAIDRRILPLALKKGMRFKCKYKRHKVDDKRSRMQGITSIHDRPAGVEKRKRIGHWESDTMLGQRKTGAFGTHVERKSGFLVALKLNSGSSEEYNATTIKAFSTLPRRARKSFTVDRGKEFTLHRELSLKLDMPVYFCDPYSPWQRGTNENTNGLLRQFFPKKTSFADVTQEELNRVTDLINNRPRKRLGWLTPAEVFRRSLRGVLHLD